MSGPYRAFSNLVYRVLQSGTMTENRTGTPALTTFGESLAVDLAYGFPAISEKKLAFKTMAGELACFLKGHTDIREFHKRGVRIWDANLKAANDKDGTPDSTDLGPIYGAQWRDFGGVDQLRKVINEAKSNPMSHRLLVSAWNPPELDAGVLPPCHTHWQIDLHDGRVNMAFYMRSVDVMLGLPFDLASYALLQTLIANELQMLPGKLVGYFANAHIYANHLDAAKEILTRTPYQYPELQLNMMPSAPVEAFEPEYAKLVGYKYHEAIPLPMAV